jgi:transglutaminase-like putative cysteine protease
MPLTPRGKWILLGLGVAAIAGYYWYRKSGVGLGRARYMPGRNKQAPVVGGYSDGNMKTTIRASEDMPIEERIATIQDLIYKSIQDPEMRKLALAVTSHCPARDGHCEAKAVYDYIKDNVRYSGDVGAIKHPDGTIEGIDLYQSARRTLMDIHAGDCDDMSIAASTLLALNGITPRLRVMKESSADDWSHIFALAGLDSKNSPTKWYAVDATLPHGEFGEEVPYAEALDFPA